MKKSNSIAFQTTVFITVPLVVALACATWLIDGQIQAISRESITKDIALVDARADQVGAILDGVVHFAVSLRSNKRLRSGTTADKLEAMSNIKAWKPQIINDVMFVYPDGKFLNAGGQTGSVASRDYYNDMMTNKLDHIISNPMISIIDKKPLFVVMVRLNDDKGEFTGFASCAIKLEALSAVCKTIQFGKTGYGWMVNGKGIVIAHPKEDMVFTFDLTTGDREKGYTGLAELNKRMQALTDESPGDNSYFIKSDKSKMITFFTRVPNSPNWTLGMTIAEEEYFAQNRRIIIMLVSICAICMLLVIAISLAIARKISRPITEAQKAFEALARGEADLTARINTAEKNEIGVLVEDFNLFTEKLRNIVLALKGEQSNLDAISEELGSRMKETAETTAAMNETIQMALEEIGKQNNLTNDSSAGVNQIAANIESLDNLIGAQTESIAEASSAVEEMVHNISAISVSMEKMATEYAEMGQSSDSEKDLIALMNEKIAKIVGQSQALLEVNKTIATIAAQTNLLAMNAAIESAHAGEAGKGFAVVADEIRRLAEDSSRQSTIISKELTSVQSSIQEIAQTANESQAGFLGMASRIANTESFMKEINRALQEQSEGSRQTLEALKSMNDLSAEVRSGASEMRAGNETILSAMNGLKTVTDSIGVRMEELASDTDGIAQKTNELARMTDTTSEAVANMEESIGRFKT